MKILESSQTLLHVLKKEDSTLNKKKMHVSTRKGLVGGNKENNTFLAASPDPKVASKMRTSTGTGKSITKYSNQTKSNAPTTQGGNGNLQHYGAPNNTLQQ